MIEQLYFDIAEETKDKKIYGKSFQSCKASWEELLGADEDGRTRVIAIA